MKGRATVAFVDAGAGLEAVGAAIVEVIDRQLKEDRHPADLLLVAVRHGQSVEAVRRIEDCLSARAVQRMLGDHLAVLRAVEAAGGGRQSAYVSVLLVQPRLPTTWSHAFILGRLDDLVRRGHLVERDSAGVHEWAPTADGLLHLDCSRSA